MKHKQRQLALIALTLILSLGCYSCTALTFLAGTSVGYLALKR